MSKHTVNRQFTEPESSGGLLHNPGEVADLDPVKVFDLADLIAQGVVGPAIEDAPAPVEPSKSARATKAPDVTPADPQAQEVTNG